jgi:uncharacterized protein YjbJ (UPF0337 family)
MFAVGKSAALQNSRERDESNRFAPFEKGNDMNTDKIKGSIKETAGKAQQEVGEATGSTKQQVKGIEKQVEGKTDKAIGNAKDAVDDDKE